MLAVGKVLLVLVTLVCLSSMGGAMLFAFPVLVPLHWLSSRRSTTVGLTGWTVLAMFSMFEAGWMIAYVVSDHEGASIAAGVAGALATSFVFTQRRASTMQA